MTSFLCELPPPYGGVTVKNQLILDKVIRESDHVNVIDFCSVKRSPVKAVPIFLRMIGAFIRKDTIIYGFGSRKRLKLALNIQKIVGGKKSLGKTVNLVMGGNFQTYLREDSALANLLASIKENFVETSGMREAFIGCGVNNTSIFPNARLSDQRCSPNKGANKLRCVFFSKICKDKGVDYIISEFTDDRLKDVSLDFYGHVDEDIKETFEAFINMHDNCHYRGVFDAAGDNVYQELNKYDILLLPTRWKGEGVPGVLVEAKMAGIVPVVSDCNYNSEIVANDEEGIVLEDLLRGELVKVILELQHNSSKLQRLKEQSYASRDRYSINTYIMPLRKSFDLRD